MDIFDINIHHITKQYMEYIKAMKQLDLEVAGEFVAMAATLIQIKSRMLLPTYNEEGEPIEGEDPRKELVNRLLEYQKFQEVSERLYERPLIGRDVWLRGRRENVEVEDDGEVIMEEENALFALISCYRKVVKKMKSSVHKVGTELQSIAERIREIKESLLVGVRIRFGELIQKSGSRRDQVLVTFLSLLELAKMGFVSLFQADAYSEIHVEAKRVIEGDALSRVEDYEHSSQETLQRALSLNETTSFEEEEEDLAAAEDGVNPSESLIASMSATDDEIEAEMARLGFDEVDGALGDVSEAAAEAPMGDWGLPEPEPTV